MSEKSLAERVGYTPGPWKMKKEKNNIIKLFIKPVAIWIKAPDARLIAATPDMFEDHVNVREAYTAFTENRIQLKDFLYAVDFHTRRSIESATGMTWEALNQPPE